MGTFHGAKIPTSNMQPAVFLNFLKICKKNLQLFRVVKINLKFFFYRFNKERKEKRKEKKFHQSYLNLRIIEFY